MALLPGTDVIGDYLNCLIGIVVKLDNASIFLCC